MNTAEATTVIVTAIAGIAPEIDLSTVDPESSFRAEIDLDSLDFLRLVQSLHDATGVEIPETDYARVDTLKHLTEYLVTHSAAAV